MCLENSLITNNILKGTDSGGDRSWRGANALSGIESGLRLLMVVLKARDGPGLSEIGGSSWSQVEKEFSPAAARYTGAHGLIPVPLQI